MTAKQKANQARFKKVVAEAKKLRKKNPKLTQAQAVKQAWAISYSKKDISVGATKKKATPTKVKAKKGKRTSEMHTDTKSHNVNIRVMSGIDNNMFKVRDQYETTINHYLQLIQKINSNLLSMSPKERYIAKVAIRTYKKFVIKLKKQLREQNKLINDLLK